MMNGDSQIGSTPRFALFAFLIAARSSAADPAGAEAEMLFRQGKALLAAGKMADACAAFDASQKLDPTTATLLNQASCREKNDQLATAWGLFLEAERTTRAASDATSQQFHQAAVDHATKLEPRLSTLTLVVASDAKVAGLEIIRNGKPVDPVMWNKTLPIDGGTYKIAARAPGNVEWSTTITVGNERDTQTIEIPRLKSMEAALSSAGDTHEDGDDRADALASAPSRRRWIPHVVGGGAVALLGAALTLELVAESNDHSANAATDPAKQTSLWNTANHERYAAIGLAACGLAASGVAAWLYFTDRRGDRGVAFAPVVGGDRAGISLIGGF